MDTYEKKYPPRELPSGAFVTRLGPSPTGFIHLGNLFTANMNYYLAKRSGGIFYLRIEDTDQKREVEGAIPMLTEQLENYGIVFGEGYGIGGGYGPYRQSERREIYAGFAEKLLSDGRAYKCYLSEGEIEEIRKEQSAKKITPGIYGEWAKYRDGAAIGGAAPVSSDASLSRADAKGKQPSDLSIKDNTDFVIRLRSSGSPSLENKIEVEDGIRGKLTMPENFQDVVLIKKDGLPTYHFAHVIDDHLMRTTHVIRGEEWLSSLPIHYELSEALGFDLPIYCHTSVLMKTENGKKRKLSKRLDPELSLSYYDEEGYHPRAIKEYLFTITNSNFEPWRMKNPEADFVDFPISLSKMGDSGILFDIDKLIDISKNVMVKMSGKKLAEFVLAWAEKHDKEFYDAAMKRGFDFLASAIDIGRLVEKPRKDLYAAKQIKGYISYLYDEYFEMRDVLPENVGAVGAKVFLENYLSSRDFSEGKEAWFAKIKCITEKMGYALRPKDYKKEPEKYKGSIADITNVLRLALTGRTVSPDIFEIESVLGEKSAKGRLEKMLGEL
jgi:glutamyl-tRNA synthetase